MDERSVRVANLIFRVSSKSIAPEDHREARRNWWNVHEAKTHLLALNECGHARRDDFDRQRVASGLRLFPGVVPAQRTAVCARAAYSYRA